MRTSNKLLIAFLVFVFLVPVFILMGFKRKIEKNDFTLEKENWLNNQVKQNLKPFTYVKLIGIGNSDRFECTVESSDSARLTFQNTESQELIDIIQEGDTLILKVKPSAMGGKDDTEIVRSINLTLADSSITSIDFENATLFVGNPQQLGLKNVSARKGDLEIGFTNSRVDTESDKIDSISNIKSDTIWVNANETNVEFGRIAGSGLINLQLTGTSHIKVGEKAKKVNLAGTVSPETSVEGPMSILGQLQLLKTTP